MTSPLLSDVYRCRPKARPRYHKCEQKYDRSRGALAGTLPCLFAALMTLCSYESFLSQTDWRSITELPTSHKISRLDFTCKLWIVPLTTDQLCLWTSFYARGGWVNLKSEPVRGDRPQNWPKKLKTSRIRIYFPTCCREVLAKAVFFCFLILRWNIFYTDALLPYSTPISTISAMRTEGQRFVWGSSKAVFHFSKCGKDQDFVWLCCNSDKNSRMNQLQSLLHDSLIATGHVQHCAIIRRKDTSLRASTVGFSVRL